MEEIGKEKSSFCLIFVLPFVWMVVGIVNHLSSFICTIIMLVTVFVPSLVCFVILPDYFRKLTEWLVITSSVLAVLIEGHGRYIGKIMLVCRED